MQFLQKCFARSSVAATGRFSSVRTGTEGFRLVALFEVRRRKGLGPPKTRYAQTVLRSETFPAADEFAQRRNLPSRRYLLIAGLFVAALPRLASAQVIISEIMYDAPGSDNHAEWVELQNMGDGVVDIAKWKFNDGSNHVLNAPPKNGSTGTTLIAPGDFLILAADAATFNASHSVQVSVIDTVMNITNDKDTLSLLDASSTVEDKISYSSSKGGNGTGESLQKVNGKLVAAKPTPGYANSSVRIAKPATAPAPAKASSKNVAMRSEPEILDGTSTAAASVADTPEPPPSAMTAAAVVPLGDSSNKLMPWIYGALALGVAGAAIALVIRQKKKGEWDIEEIA
jgi:hypothetical protein